MAVRDGYSTLMWLTDGNGQLQEFKVEAGPRGRLASLLLPSSTMKWAQ